MLATKDCQAFVQALAYWNPGGRSPVSQDGVVETRITLAQLKLDLGDSVGIGTPTGWLHSWPNVRLGGRLGILFAMDFGESCAVHFAALSADEPLAPATPRPSPAQPARRQTASD
jgi:hypothetical protein